MIRPGAYLSLASSADHVARAILIGAKKRTSTLRFLWLSGLGRIEGRLWTVGITRHAVHTRQLLVVIRAIPIARPLPHVPRHIIKTVAVRRKPPDCRDPHVVVFSRVLVWKMTLKRIGHPLSFWPKLIPPDKWLSSQSTACREFPFGLGWQSLTGPFRISRSILVGDVHHRIVPLSLNAGSRAQRVVPVRARNIRPPLIMIIQGDFMVRRRENHRSRDKIFRWRAWKVLRPGFAFRHGDVPGGLHKSRELPIRNVSLIHPEAVNVHAVNRT